MGPSVQGSGSIRALALPTLERIMSQSRRVGAELNPVGSKPLSALTRLRIGREAQSAERRSC